MRRVGVGGLLALLLVACGQSVGARDGGEDAGVDAGPGDGGNGGLDPAPVILTEQLLPARMGQPYLEKVSARGTPPFHWSLSELPPELGWLTLDPAAGTLTGTPPLQAPSEWLFTVQVRDGSDAGRIDSRSLALRLTECDDGASEPCFVPSVAVCLEGTRTCGDGGWGACGGGRGSVDPDSCDASCSSCGPGANACADGRCACGAGPACPAGAPTCCGSGADAGCANLLADPDSCGGCGVACDPGARLHVARVCDAGVCSFPCGSSRYANCDTNAANGCEADLQSPTTCGSCTNVCSVPGGGGWATCDAGACGQDCPGGTRLCQTNTGGTTPTTCYPNDNPSNCGGCGRYCPSAPPNASSGTCTGGTCVMSCAQWYANCDTDWSNGCETNVRADRNHCGGCNSLCPADGGPGGSGAYCVDGGCTFCESCGLGLLCCLPNACDRSFTPPKCLPQ